MSELGAHEVKATEVRVGDVMEHRLVTESGGLGRVVESEVDEVEVTDEVEVVLEDGYAFYYPLHQYVVVYRPV